MTASSLGAYPPETGEGRAELVEVRLEGLPVALLLAAREHHDGLLRELRLLSMEADAGADHAPARLVELVDALVVEHAAARSRRDQAIDAALERGEETVDLAEHVPADIADVVATLSGLLEECDRFCEQGQLMTLPRTPLVRRLTEWYLTQYRDQVQGRPPVRWDGPTRLTPPPG